MILDDGSQRATDADADAFRQSVRSFVERTYRPSEERFIVNRGLDRELWRSAAEVGLLGINVPAVYGGLEVSDYSYVATAIAELARGGVALASCLSVHFDVVVPYFVAFGTDAQNAQWLPAMSDGSVVAGIAMTEPGAGSDLSALRSVATRRGDTWVLSGTKTLITNGASADVFIVAARTGPAKRNISLFIVPADRAGFHRGRKLDKIGLPQADTAELVFEDVVLSDAELLGPVDGGFEIMRRQLARERLGAAVSCLSHAQSTLEQTLRYVSEREVFNLPVGQHQANRFRLAVLHAQLEVMSAFVDSCVAQHSAGQLSDVRAAIAKWQASELQNVVVDECLQLHGGYGYMLEYPIARAWMDARVTRIWAGTNEIMAEIVSRDLYR